MIERSDWALRSENLTVDRPAVIRLISYVRIPRDAHSRKITRRAVFARDRWTCQYCGGVKGTLTIDHVVPRSRGGKTSWDNCVLAHREVNSRKADRLPHEPVRLMAQELSPVVLDLDKYMLPPAEIEALVHEQLPGSKVESDGYTLVVYWEKR